jgi:hypothetical protein
LKEKKKKRKRKKKKEKRKKNHWADCCDVAVAQINYPSLKHTR